MSIRVSVVALAVALAVCSARAADVDDVKEKLFEAKKEYDAETRKFRTAVNESLDKREDAARKAGDKKAVDQVKTDRERYEKSGELPRDTSKALLTQIGAARAKLDKAFATAVKDLIRMKEDTAAEAVEKEYGKFQTDAAIQFGKRTNLSVVKAFDVKVEQADYFKPDLPVKIDEVVTPHCVFMHPPARGSSQASYPLAGKYAALQASVGVPYGKQLNPKLASAITFEVLGDGKVLWKSEPATEANAFQTAQVKVAGVKTLTLRTTSAGHNGAAWAHWFGPILAE